MSQTLDDLDDLDTEIDDEEQTPQAPPAPPQEDDTPEAREAKARRELEEEVRAVRTGQTKNADSMAELLALGKKFLENSNKPEPVAAPSADAGNKALEDFGRKLKDAIVLGDDPTAIAKLFVQGADGVAQQRQNEMLMKFGGPLAEKAGEFTVQAFLSKIGSERGPNKEKQHGAIARRFNLSEDERAWVATAPAKDADTFLRSRYRQTAGDVWLDASERAKPSNLAPGSGGGGAANDASVMFPGLSASQQKKQMKLAEMYWPDPKVREAKLKDIAARMAAGE